jgi:hypothetical protein
MLIRIDSNIKELDIYKNKNIKLDVITSIDQIVKDCISIIKKECDTYIGEQIFINDIPYVNGCGFKIFVVTKELLEMTCEDLFYKDMLDHDGESKQTCIDKTSELAIKDDKIKYKELPYAISFKRTLRVPDDDKHYNLPPNLGNFPLYKNENEILLPMYQREALWINFDNFDNYDEEIAIKVGIGDINAITGKKWKSGKFINDPQNYMILPKQPWLDGIYLENVNETLNYVRQFVAMPLEHESTIESQLLKQNKITTLEKKGGLKFEIFKLNNDYLKCYVEKKINKDKNTKPLKIKSKYIKLNQVTEEIKIGDIIIIYSNKYKINFEDYKINSITYADKLVNITINNKESIFVKTLTGKTIVVDYDPNMFVWEFKFIVQEKTGTKAEKQRMIYAGKQLSDGHILEHYNIQIESTIHLVLHLRGGGYGEPTAKQVSEVQKMGIAMGGKIVQKIYKDTNIITKWNTSMYDSFNINIINGTEFYKLTNKIMPDTPISSAKYSLYGFPWFKIYDEHIPSIKQTKTEIESENSESLFENIDSISKFKHKGKTCDICMEHKTNIKFSKCNHRICSECYDTIKKKEPVADFKCPFCTQTVKNEISITSAIY